ncbi:unnamed protein product, partial [Prorocentrum cordatum]
MSEPRGAAPAAARASEALEDGAGGHFEGVATLTALRAKLGEGGEAAKALAAEGPWERLKAALAKCDYGEDDAADLRKDLRTLGGRGFLKGVPADLGPRGRAALQEMVAVLSESGRGPRNLAGPPGFWGEAPGGAPPPFDAPPAEWRGAGPAASASGNLFLGKVGAAAAQQDTEALEELASQWGPTVQLRTLAKQSKQGEPLRSLEPDEAALRAAASARKAGRFLACPEPKTPCRELPRLWAAALERRVSWGGVLNYGGQVAAAANDKAVPQHVAEQAAAFNSSRVLFEAYSSSKRGEGDEEGRGNASSVLGELDWSRLTRCQTEVKQAGAAAPAASAAAGQGGLAFPCRRFLFGQCPKQEACQFRHGCPFCRATGPGSHKCLVGHLEQNGFSRRGGSGGKGGPEDGRGGAPSPAAASSAPLESDALQGRPLAPAGLRASGVGEAFAVARGWVADSAVAVHPRGAVATVPSRGLPPAQHLRVALQLAAAGSHPLHQLPVIAEGTACALSAQFRCGAGINEVRLKRLALLKVWKRELEVSQQSLAASVDPALRGFASEPTLLFLRLLRLIGSPAVQFLENMHRGLPDTGVPAASSIFPPLPAAASEWSVEQLLAHSAGRNAELVDRVRRGRPRAAEVWEQGARAEATGSLGPAWPVEHFQSGAGGGANVVFCRKFAVCQKRWSEDESGQASCSTEIRACADASDSPGGCFFNLTWAAAERIVCSDSEVILAQMVASQRAFGVPPVGCKDDLRKAYHQVGRRRDPVRVVQLFWHPRDKCVVGRELLSQDFGT